MNEKIGMPVNVDNRIPQQREGETVVFRNTALPKAGTDQRVPEQRDTYKPILGRLREGDPDEWTKWMQKQTPGLLRSASHRINSKHLAEDLVQDAWTRVYAHVTNPERSMTGDNLPGFAQRTLINLIADHYKSSRSRLETVTDIIDGQVDTVAPEKVEDTVLSRIENQALYAAIDRLNPHQRTVILHELAGKSIKETADTMGITEGAVKALKYRATRTMRRLIEAQEQKYVEEVPPKKKSEKKRRTIRPATTGKESVDTNHVSKQTEVAVSSHESSKKKHNVDQPTALVTDIVSAENVTSASHVPTELKSVVSTEMPDENQEEAGKDTGLLDLLGNVSILQLSRLTGVTPGIIDKIRKGEIVQSGKVTKFIRGLKNKREIDQRIVKLLEQHVLDAE